MHHIEATQTISKQLKEEYIMSITTMSKLVEAYRELLNEIEPEVTLYGCTFKPATILEELDPVAFRCGYLDYADSLDIDTDELEDDI